jgi:hypothetical protein
MNYHILWLKVEKNKIKIKICFYKENSVLEVEIGNNRLGILGIQGIKLLVILMTYPSYECTTMNLQLV